MEQPLSNQEHKIPGYGVCEPGKPKTLFFSRYKMFHGVFSLLLKLKSQSRLVASVLQVKVTLYSDKTSQVLSSKPPDEAMCADNKVSLGWMV